MESITQETKKSNRLKDYQLHLIHFFYKQRMGVNEISRQLGVNKSTISRELKRGLVELKNSDLSMRVEYSVYHSLVKRKKAKQKQGRHKKISNNIDKYKELLGYIQEQLNNNTAPDAIAGSIRVNNLFGDISLSGKTLYNYINKGILKYANYKKRKQKVKREYRMSYNNPQGRSIDERPFTAKERRFGDWSRI